MQYMLSLQKEMEGDVPCDVIYFDFQKCFDKISHAVLLKKLKQTGISGHIGQWLQNFLKNRLQCVKVNESKSPFYQVHSSVIQGSVIGPALFLIMINDLPKIFDNPTYKFFFADDFKLMMPITNGIISVNELQNQIDKAYQWSIENKLPFNAQKCEVLHIGKYNPKFAYTIGADIIRSVSNVCDLGIQISDTKLLKPAFENAIQRSTHAAINARLHLKNADFGTRVMVWNSYILPLIEYGAELWAPNNINTLYDLNRPYKEFFAQITPLSDSKIPFTPSQRVILLELLTLYDYVTKYGNLATDLFFDPLIAPQITRSITTQQLKPTRNISDQLPKLLYKRVSLWNNIPQDVRSGTKSELKTHIESVILPTIVGHDLQSKLSNGSLHSKSTFFAEFFSK